MFAAETDMHCSVWSTETACAVPVRIMDGWEKLFPRVHGWFQGRTVCLVPRRTCGRLWGVAVVMSRVLVGFSGQSPKSLC